MSREAGSATRGRNAQRIVAVAWLAIGTLLLVGNAFAFVDALRDSNQRISSMQLGPNPFAAAAAAFGLVIAGTGLIGAYGLLRHRPASRGVLEVSTWALLLWLPLRTFASSLTSVSRLIVALDWIGTAIMAVPVIVLLLAVRSRALRGHLPPA